MTDQEFNTAATMMRFTTALEKEPKKAYEIISREGWQLDKDDLLNIVKELIYSVQYHVDNSFYMDLFSEIMGDVATELDEQYDELYLEYADEIDELNKKYATEE